MRGPPFGSLAKRKFCVYRRKSETQQVLPGSLLRKAGLEVRMADFKKGDTIIAKKTLKQTKKDKEIIYPILDIKTENCLIDIYFDGKKIAGNYNNKNDNYVSIKRNYTAWLPDNYDGKELKIIFSLQQTGATSILKNITIITR